MALLFMIVWSIICLSFSLTYALCNAKIYNVKQFRVDPTGHNVCTKGIIEAITEASKNNGGVVHFPKGTYLTGPIHLKTSKQLKPTEHVLIGDSLILAGHAGIGMVSATAGALRNITVKNCFLNGLYITTARDRGGKVEDIHYHNITMLKIRKERIAIADVYNGTDEGPHERDVYREPVTEATPFIRNIIEFQGIPGNSKLESIFIVGLPESAVINITFNDFVRYFNEVYKNQIASDIRTTLEMALGNITCLLLALISLTASAREYNVTDFGADSTGKSVSTIAITTAIERAAEGYGGVVRFTKGQYLSGPFELKSNITLQFDDDALLVFEDNQKLYPPLNITLPNGERYNLSYTPLISAFSQKNISIRGRGILDGSGASWIKLLPPPSTRPFFLYFAECQEVLLEGIHIKNSPMYNVHFKDTDHIKIKGITITNPENTVDPGPNTDGINCDPCRYLHVSNVTISTGDDAIVMKADMRGRTSKQLKPTEHVLIENSHIFAGHAGISMGSATAGGLRNITVRNCFLNGTNRGLYIKTARDRGGKVEDIHYHNITMLNIRKEGVAIADVYNGTDEGLHERGVYPEPVTEATPFIRNIEFQGIRGNSKLESIFIVGLPESPVVNITFNDFYVKSDFPIFLNQTKHIVINEMAIGSITCVLLALISLTVSAKEYNVTDFGADSTGKDASTIAITTAIDRAAEGYGGVVRFTKGQYLSGPFELKSNITLQFDDDVVLKFSDDPKEYPSLTKVLPNGQTFYLPFTPLIRAFIVRNVAIRGNAVLDGNGVPWWKRLPPPNARPKFLFFYQSYNVTLEDVAIKNSISIKNPPNYVDPGPNTDGINCNPCRYLHVTNVTIDTGDDCVALDADIVDKTMGRWPTEHILIENSHMFAGHGAVSIGSGTTAGLRNITVRNCIFNGTNRGLYIKSRRGRGGLVEDIHYHNITMLNIRKEGVAIATVYNGTDEGMHERNIHWVPINDTTPFIRNIRYRRIRGNSKLESLFIVGLPELQVTDVILDDFHVQSEKGIFLNQTQHILINGNEQ
nr:unnamed protein product [Callosobruchus chinensis]